MKEVTKNEAMAGTWKEMGFARRTKLLHELQTGSDVFTKDISIGEVCKEEEWWKLPIPLRTFLEGHFGDGEFSQAVGRERERLLAAHMASFDKDERALQ